VEGLRSRLFDPVFDKALGVLEMIQKTPEQRRHYEDSLRLERDEKARMQAAIEDGKAEGKAEEKANTIRLLEGLLRMETTSMAELQGQ